MENIEIDKINEKVQASQMENYIKRFQKLVKTEMKSVVWEEKDVAQMSDYESFQNNVLRPILKFQHQNIALVFEDYAAQIKWIPSEIQTRKNRDFIQKAMINDKALKHHYIGLITGLFGEPEMKFYFENKKEINKRIISMLIERISNHVSKE